VARWTQKIHGPLQAHVLRLKCCALSIIGGGDWWAWTVRCSRHGARVQGKEGALHAAKAAAEQIARRLASNTNPPEH
jgi:hypothetical protein